MYFDTIQQMKKTLGQLSTWLEKGVEYAKQRPFDSATYLSLRLAPDQLPFVKQVQIACDTAKLAAARLTGKAAPSHDDKEQSIEELLARVRSVREYLDSFKAADFEAAATRLVTQPRWEGKVMTGHDYFLEHALPNFFFHAAHTYAILRHAGVPLGKKDYLGALSLRAP